MSIRKRFTGFLLTAFLLMIGLVVGPPESYAAFSAALGLAYAAFLGGQSYTDGKEHGQD